MTKLLAGLLLAVSIGAQAEAIMWCYNTTGGKIVLTDEKCTRGTAGRMAYTLSTNPNAETLIGCWTRDALAIHVLWDGSVLKSYDYSDWHIIKNDATL